VGAEVGRVSQVYPTKQVAAVVNVSSTELIGRNATKTLSAARILFGAIFLFDGIMKWVLFQQGTMQATIQGYGYDSLSTNWVAVGVLVGLGETFGGLTLMMGLFQRPAAMWSAAIMFAIWVLGGFAVGAVPGGSISWVGYTDPGGDLMLALVFVVLIFSPYAYGLASRLKLRNRWPGSSIKDKVLRFLVT